MATKTNNKRTPHLLAATPVRTVFRAIPTALFLVFLFASCCPATVRNLTEENRILLDNKISELRQTELLRMTRGRIKPNPVALPFFTFYESLLLNRDLMLKSQLDDFSAAVAEFARAKIDFSSFAKNDLGDVTIQIFDERLINAYSLSDELEKSESMLDIWSALAASRRSLQSLPVELRIALDSGKWMMRMSDGKQLPGELLDRYLMLCRNTSPPATDVFSADAEVSRVSAEHAKLLLDFSRIRGIDTK